MLNRILTVGPATPGTQGSTEHGAAAGPVQVMTVTWM